MWVASSGWPRDQKVNGEFQTRNPSQTLSPLTGLNYITDSRSRFVLNDLDYKKTPLKTWHTTCNSRITGSYLEVHLGQFLFRSILGMRWWKTASNTQRSKNSPSKYTVWDCFLLSAKAWPLSLCEYNKAQVTSSACGVKEPLSLCPCSCLLSLLL